jgi:broad specificity phosphatase PhoE
MPIKKHSHAQKTPNQRLYLIRHATPDWDRKDIPYNIPPGPPLVEKGEKEAGLLGGFLKQAGVKRLYYSPMERSARTAQIAAHTAQIPFDTAPEVIEKSPHENFDDVVGRIWPFWERCVLESNQQGSIGIVTHGGPVWIVLSKLNMDAALLDRYRHMFDGDNPLPPAGVWEVKRKDEASPWEFNLAFIPQV